MLTKVSIKRFKRFSEAEIELGSAVLLVGPNNRGKTSALQALALWSFGCKSWIDRRGTGEVAGKRPGITLNRKDLVGLPIGSALLLWNDLHVREGKVDADGIKGTRNILISIVVSGVSEGIEWECGFEFDYANEEAIYCRPLRDVEGNYSAVPPQIEAVKVAFLPPMSGLSASETRLPDGRIDVLIGEGRTAEVLRNLCFKVSQDSPAAWIDIKDRLFQLFRVKLRDPVFLAARGELELQYQDENGILLDIQCAGRGLQQTLLLIAHMFANPGSILLLDEPDAHLEFLRQREIYNLLTEQARTSGGQIIAASHSEVLLNEAADKDVVVSFVGKPKRIDDRGSQVVKSLKQIGFENYLMAEQTGWVVYLEGSTDLAILKAFAKILDHEATAHLERPFVHYIANHLSDAKSHFYGLLHAFPDLKGLALLDRSESPQGSDGNLAVHYWNMREIENYLMFPAVLERFARSLGGEQVIGPLFAEESDRFQQAMHEAIVGRVTPKALNDPADPWWTNVKASDEFLDLVFDDFYQSLKLPNLMRKTDYHTLISFIERDEVHTDVIEVLDVLLEISRSQLQ
jgi:hypothetical protein